MAASLIIDEECGTCRGVVHAHNGYYAGDFSNHRGNRVTNENLAVTSHSQCDPATDPPQMVPRRLSLVTTDSSAEVRSDVGANARVRARTAA